MLVMPHPNLYLTAIYTEQEAKEQALYLCITIVRHRKDKTIFSFLQIFRRFFLIFLRFSSFFVHICPFILVLCLLFLFSLVCALVVSMSRLQCFSLVSEAALVGFPIQYLWASHSVPMSPPFSTNEPVIQYLLHNMLSCKTLGWETIGFSRQPM